MMSDVAKPVARIGMVHYINMAPLVETWKARVHDRNWQLIEAHPAALNRMLASAEIDLGFVSSHEYGIRPDAYLLLDDLSISSTGAVGSVLLFSRVEPQHLSGRTVLLSVQSKTSVCLVRIVLERFFSVSPVYVEDEIGNARQRGVDAVLAIGDDALRLKRGEAYRYRLDLGEVWMRYTGLPFVFGVCAVRSGFAKAHPRLVDDIHRELLVCRKLANITLADICAVAAPRIPMEIETCRTYLKGIEYNLGPRKREALERFYTYLFDFNEAVKPCLPLKIRKAEE
jgi:chorismate dehydratase